jgi:mannose/fructose/N-acetylgalactosamine-specific phosphotransferase system component IID
MKLKIDDDANVNVNVEHGVPVEDIQDVIDKVVDGAITILVVGTICAIIKKQLD